MATTPGNEGNEQITRVWVTRLTNTSTMDLREFYDYFYKPIQPEVDLVIIYDNDNRQCGFGFVVNEESRTSGGIFRTVPYWANRLKLKIADFCHALRNMHCTAQSKNCEHLHSAINFNQLKTPLNPSLLQQSQILDYFQNLSPSSDFNVVALFPDERCGFGFVQIPSTDSENSGTYRNYLDELKVFINQLMAIVDGGITTICSESNFAQRASIRPPFNRQSVLPYAQSDLNFGIQHQQPQSSIGYQSIAAVRPYEVTYTPSGPWRAQLPSSGRLFGGEQYSSNLQWSGSGNAAVMPQPIAAVRPYEVTYTPSGPWRAQLPSSGRLFGGEQYSSNLQWSGSGNASVMPQPIAAVRPYEVTYTPSGPWRAQLPSSGRLFGGEQYSSNLQWSGSGNAAVMPQPIAAVRPYEVTNTPSGPWRAQLPSSGRLFGGEQYSNNLQWSGSGNAAVMPQPIAALRPYEVTNTPSGPWRAQLPSSGRLFGGEQYNSNLQWSGSGNAAGMQHPQSLMLSQPFDPYSWDGQATSTGRLSIGNQYPHQLSGNGNATVLQQPEASTADASRLGQSRNA